MPTYAESLAKSRLVKHLGYERATEDHTYNGTALEVYDEKGGELFHIIVDEKTGEKQIWFSPQTQDWRVSLDHLLEAIKLAEEWVAVVPPLEEDGELVP